MYKFTLFFLLCFSVLFQGMGQPVPSQDQNIHFLVTFGAYADPADGDDDGQQVIYFKVPQHFKDPVYLNIYDPDCGGAFDESHGQFNTSTLFSIYGGKGAFTSFSNISPDPENHSNEGILLDKKTFGISQEYDQKWFSFGPFSPQQGELVDGGYVFKIVAKGTRGNDGNLYKYFLSKDEKVNVGIEGANLLAYEYTFRVPKGKCYLRPFLSPGVTKAKLYNFDFDSDGTILVSSHGLPKGKLVDCSENGKWAHVEIEVGPKDQGTHLTLEITSEANQEENNMVFYMRSASDQYQLFTVSPVDEQIQPFIGTILFK